MITGHQRALLYRAKCITEIPQRKFPKQICLALSEIWGVGISPKPQQTAQQSCFQGFGLAFDRTLTSNILYCPDTRQFNTVV